MDERDNKNIITYMPNTFMAFLPYLLSIVLVTVIFYLFETKSTDIAARAMNHMIRNQTQKTQVPGTFQMFEWCLALIFYSNEQDQMVLELFYLNDRAFQIRLHFYNHFYIKILKCYLMHSLFDKSGKIRCHANHEVE